MNDLWKVKAETSKSILITSGVVSRNRNLFCTIKEYISCLLLNEFRYCCKLNVHIDQCDVLFTY